MKESIPNKYIGQTVVVVATGPSINAQQLEHIHEAHQRKKCKIMTINNTYQLFDTDIHVSCNDNWWDYYWKNDPRLQELEKTADLWTRYKQFAENTGINYIDSIVKDGLSKDPSYVHINNGSGPMGINFATLYGFTKIILIGHDMKFAKDYDGKAKKVGSEPRHYFNEYPKEMQHWPSVKIGLSKPGVIDGLIQQYEKMIPDLKGIDVVNCTPDSALTCFRMSTLEYEL
jgi:hypothetical protein